MIHTRHIFNVILVLTAMFTAFLGHLPKNQQQQKQTYEFVHVVFDEPREHPGIPIEIYNPELAPALQREAAPPQISSEVFAYTELDTLIAIYPNTAAGTLNDADIARLQQHIADTVKFYWQHSHMRLFINTTFFVISDYKDASEFTEVGDQSYWLFPGDDDLDGSSLENDLLARGVTNNAYDSINFLWAHNNGSIPAAYGGLGGTWSGQLGYTGISMNPIFQASGESRYSTAFPHELQHSVDFMLSASGYPEYFHADQPWYLPGSFGENWSFWVHGMGVWPVQNWLAFSSPWGDIQSAPDLDQDRVPDSGDSLPITEQSLGSSLISSDTDEDGLSDLDEVMSGVFLLGDLNNYDSDQDKALDGNDPEPLYPVNVYIKENSQILDGNPVGWEELYAGVITTNTPLNPTVYANWNNNYLYIMARVDKYAGINLKIDATGDGWFHGKDNYEIGLDPSYPNPNDEWIVGYARIFDCSPELIAAKGIPMYDDEANYPGQRLVRPSDILRYARPDGDGYLVQIAIPANPATGLLPQHGRRLGLRIFFNYINRQGELNAWAFEEDDLVYLSMWDDDAYPPGFCDSFNTGMVDQRWTWTDPLRDSSYNQTENPGYLRLSTPDGNHDLHLNTNAPRLLQLAGRRFEVATQVSLLPTAEEYQGAGLLIWQDTNNYVRLELKTWGDLRFIYRAAGSYHDSGDIHLATDSVFLRFKRKDDTITALYSLNGETWIEIDQVMLSFVDTVSVGVHIINEWQDNPLQADFNDLSFNWCNQELFAKEIYLPIIFK